MSGAVKNKGRRLHDRKIPHNVPVTRIREYTPVSQHEEKWFRSLTYSTIEVTVCEWEFPFLREGNNIYYTTTSW